MKDLSFTRMENGSEPGRERDSGASLVELIVAIVVVLLAFLLLFQARLMVTKSPTNNTTDQEAAMDSIATANDALKNYVTADHTANTATAYASPNYSATCQTSGPVCCPTNVSGCWQLPGDTCSWALDPNCNPHNATQYLATGVLQRHPGATLNYVVTSDGAINAFSVQFSVNMP